MHALSQTTPQMISVDVVHKRPGEGTILNNLPLRVQIVGGRRDRISSITTVRALAQSLGLVAEEIDGGHLVPFEQPLKWRAAVISFLNGNTQS
jgi:pimeloyl-ACP methyl ester carboxylesterase